ncbi:MAG: GAF domain-containing protein, partial [Candidatus Eisenbacteria bacterium]|nr:GAF domain-containing protein [Candidatus Eisenbacteria bacterium]
MLTADRIADIIDSAGSQLASYESSGVAACLEAASPEFGRGTQQPMGESRKRPEPAPDREPDSQKEPAPEASRRSPPTEGLSRLEREWLASGPPQEAEDREDRLPSPPAHETREEQLRSLLSLTSRISQVLDLNPLLVQILDAVLEISGCDRAIIMLANSEGRLEFMAGRDRERQAMTAEDVQISHSLANRTYRSGRPVWEENLQDLEGKLPGESISRLSLETVICLPMNGPHGVLGVLYLDSRSAGQLAREDLSILESFAFQATIAIENARLHQQVAKQRDSLALENTVLRREMEKTYAFDRIIGQSPPMKGLFNVMERVLDVTTPVLIVGETGTGKELIAKALHYHGPRSDGPFVPANCGAMSDTLLWSTLFGHRKGSFTGAIEDKAGLFELANQGSLFLDEIGELSPTIQAALLRVLQDGVISRLGEEQRPRRIDVRLLYATHRN